ncbi:alpha-D-ribose 1-methylphosphonate 5-triphosphate diphosphatase [Algicella marina]|uniref:Alpha-D-ribose 1-methylphosphonate 5-triphosphate diphosphatase n=1 Tax=Algicella marina TaxID=2683284 RepID=A0A6P1T1Z9_9RHOB|nr:alpha-D-ribose 1-methylphosphonate 5-triphosphate diphosphatase [Algicella marina]QHQ35683.1 alpha-D-ribose 1-methylphosphonate 5-triphosphate diphosphatase [Algicella marina]
MNTGQDSLCLQGGKILRGGALEDGTLGIAGALLADAGNAPVLETTGYLVLPGIIDLHGDAFEHHMAPRPTAPLPFAMGLVGVDSDAAANGVTTAWMAQSWSWEGGARGPDYAVGLLEALEAYRPQAGTDLRIQIRCETHTMETEGRLIDAIRRFRLGYVVFNNHLEEALEMGRRDLASLTGWASRTGRTPQQHLDLVLSLKARDAEASAYLARLSAVFAQEGVRSGSHDDADTATRTRFADLGARICEFPTGVAAARAAHTAGDPVLMGAPNIVRGGSQSGNIAAADLVAEGLCDALVSDYHYPTLARAAFRLADDGLLSLADAWALISCNPARIMAMPDRGELADGRRADLVIIDEYSRRIEGTMVAGRWTHLSGNLAARLARSPLRARVAAE